MDKIKLVYISTFFPYPPTAGGRLRVSNIIKRIVDSFEIHLIALCSEEPVNADMQAIKKYCESITIIHHHKGKLISAIQSIVQFKPYEITRFSSKKMLRSVMDLEDRVKPDVIYVSRLAGAQFIPEETNAVTVLDQHDLNSYLWEIEKKNARSHLIRIYSWINHYLVDRFQRKIFPRFDIIVSVSEYEKKLTEIYIDHQTKCITASNGVDIEKFKPGRRDQSLSQSIVITGSMDERRNIDAVLFFAEKIYPGLKRKFPELEFIIVGRNPVSSVVKLASIEGITVTGTVPDVRPYIKNASVVVLPYRMGSGVKHKLPISMAMKKAIVTTSNGCQGIGIIHGQHALIAETVEEFQKAVENILTDPKLSKKLGQEANDLVSREYNWDHIVNKLIKEIFSSIDDRKK